MKQRRLMIIVFVLVVIIAAIALLLDPPQLDGRVKAGAAPGAVNSPHENDEQSSTAVMGSTTQIKAPQSGRLEDSAVLSPLLQSEAKPSSRFSSMASNMLVGETDDHVARALNFLSATDPSARARAAAELGEIGDPRAEPALRNSLLMDPSSEVRAEAALALSSAVEASSITALVGALADSDEWVTDNARVALMNVNSSLSERALRAAIDSPDSRIAYESANILENTFGVELPEDFWFRYTELEDANK